MTEPVDLDQIERDARGDNSVRRYEHLIPCGLRYPPSAEETMDRRQATITQLKARIERLENSDRKFREQGFGDFEDEDLPLLRACLALIESTPDPEAVKRLVEAAKKSARILHSFDIPSMMELDSALRDLEEMRPK